MIAAGVDVGTRFLKVCIAGPGGLLGSSCRPMNGNFKALYRTVFAEAMAVAGSAGGKALKRREVKAIIATGYGAHLVTEASSALNEGVCIARAAHELDRRVRTVIDAGGLFIRITTVGPGGFAEHSSVNEKCAAGSGKFLEMISEAVEVPFEAISGCAESSDDPFPITAGCAVFAESDVISHINGGRSAHDILAGVINSIASKAVTLLESAGADDIIAVTGGLCRVPAFVASLRRMSGREIITLPMDPQVLAAFGGAMIAQGRSSTSPRP